MGKEEWSTPVVVAYMEVELMAQSPCIASQEVTGSQSQDHPTGDKKKDLFNEMGSVLITLVTGSPHS